MFSGGNLQSLAHDLRLCRCQAECGSDKGYIHSYLEKFYEPLLRTFKHPESILEIGIYKGSSLVLWRYAFPNCSLTGIDIQDFIDLNPMFKSQKDSGVFNLFYGDAYNSEKIYSALDKYDLIIDDGPHTLESQIEVIRFRELLTQGGILVIEDVPNLHFRLRCIRRELPKELRENLFAVGYGHLTGRFDDGLIVYCEDPRFREWVNSNVSWLSRSPLLQSYLISLLPLTRGFFRLISRRTRHISHSSWQAQST
jgi:hypothetical protein